MDGFLRTHIYWVDCSGQGQLFIVVILLLLVIKPSVVSWWSDVDCVMEKFQGQKKSTLWKCGIYGTVPVWSVTAGTFLNLRYCYDVVSYSHTTPVFAYHPTLSHTHTPREDKGHNCEYVSEEEFLADIFPLGEWLSRHCWQPSKNKWGRKSSAHVLRPWSSA